MDEASKIDSLSGFPQKINGFLKSKSLHSLWILLEFCDFFFDKTTY